MYCQMCIRDRIHEIPHILFLNQISFVEILIQPDQFLIHSFKMPFSPGYNFCLFICKIQGDSKSYHKQASQKYIETKVLLLFFQPDQVCIFYNRMDAGNYRILKAGIIKDCLLYTSSTLFA